MYSNLNALKLILWLYLENIWIFLCTEAFFHWRTIFLDKNKQIVNVLLKNIRLGFKILGFINGYIIIYKSYLYLYEKFLLIFWIVRVQGLNFCHGIIIFIFRYINDVVHLLQFFEQRSPVQRTVRIVFIFL